MLTILLIEGMVIMSPPMMTMMMMMILMHRDEEPLRERGHMTKEEKEHLAPGPNDLLLYLLGTEGLLDSRPSFVAYMKARIAEHAAVPTPPLPVVSLPLPLPSPLTTSPTDAGTLLGYMAAKIQMRATNHLQLVLRDRTTLEADLMRDRVMETGYEITDTWDEMLKHAGGSTDHLEGGQPESDRACCILLEIGHITATRLMIWNYYIKGDVCRYPWTSSEDKSAAIDAHVKALEAQVATLIA
ncbi:hypothetical protein Tco_0008174 [Tanacetum coccineum]